MKVEFPTPYDQRNYDVHYQYVLNLLRYAGVEVELKIMRETAPCVFPMIVNGKTFQVDYSDLGEGLIDASKPCFRFHCKSRGALGNAYPFPPVSFHDWTAYDRLSQKLQYTCAWDRILMKQRSYGDAVERRDNVRSMLVNEFEELVDTKHDDGQEEFWLKGSECLVSVHVPGRCNNMLDRAQFQLMGLGVCTISPLLPEIFQNIVDSFGDPVKAHPLNFSEPLEGYTGTGGCQYIRCRDDYSDLKDIIQWCRRHRETCKGIGVCAKEFFQATATPRSVVQYMEGVCNSVS